MKAIYSVSLLALAFTFCAPVYPHGRSELAQEIRPEHAQVPAEKPRALEPQQKMGPVPNAEPRGRHREPLLGPVPTAEPHKPLKLSLALGQQVEGHAGTKAPKTVTPSPQPKAPASKTGITKQPVGQPATGPKPTAPQ